MSDVLPADAPPEHIAFKEVKWNKAKCPYASFERGGIRFQTTLGKCFTQEATLRVARACYLQFEAGKSKEEVTAFRKTCYDALARQRSANPTPQPSEIPRPAAASEASQLAETLRRDTSETPRPAKRQKVAEQDQTPTIEIIDVEDDEPLSQMLVKRDTLAQLATGSSSSSSAAPPPPQPHAESIAEARLRKQEGVHSEEKQLEASFDDYESDPEWALESDPATVKEDVPPNHISHEKLKVTCPGGNGYRVQFTANGIRFQTTVARAGGSEQEALRIARLCYQRLEQGCSKEDVSSYREELYQKLAASANGVETRREQSAPQVFTRQSEGETSRVEKVVEDYDPDEEVGEEPEMGKVHNGRVGLPAESPIRLAHRRNFMFVSQTKERGIYARSFMAACPLEAADMPPENTCDLCGIACPRSIFVLRCYERLAPASSQSAKPLLRPEVFYAGEKCTETLLGKRSTPSKKLAQRQLLDLFESADFAAQIKMFNEQWKEMSHSRRSCLRKVLKHMLRQKQAEGKSGSSGQKVAKQSGAASKPASSSIYAKGLQVTALRERIAKARLRVEEEAASSHGSSSGQQASPCKDGNRKPNAQQGSEETPRAGNATAPRSSLPEADVLILRVEELQKTIGALGSDDSSSGSDSDSESGDDDGDESAGNRASTRAATSSNTSSSSSMSSEKDLRNRLQQLEICLQEDPQGKSVKFRETLAAVRAIRVKGEEEHLLNSIFLPKLNELRNKDKDKEAGTAIHGMITEVIHEVYLNLLDGNGQPLWYICSGCDDLKDARKKQAHSSRCPGAIKCGGCKALLLPADLESHEISCLKNASCPGIGCGFARFHTRAQLRQHASKCRDACICPLCRRILGRDTTQMKEHARICKVRICPGCTTSAGMMLESQFETHVSQCGNLQRCNGCRLSFPKSRIEIHYGKCEKMDKCICGVWKSTEQMASHKASCSAAQQEAADKRVEEEASLKDFCKGCGKLFFRDMLRSHYSQCQGMFDCRGCLKRLPKSEEEDHCMMCSALQSCRFCNQFYKKKPNAEEKHLKSCKKIARCEHCQQLYKKDEKCEAIRPCQDCFECDVHEGFEHLHAPECKAREKCTYCSSYPKKKEMQLHLAVCKGKKKYDNETISKIVQIPQRAMGQFIGKGGANRNKLEQEHSVKIWSVTDGETTIKGRRKCVIAACKAIQVFLKEYSQENGTLETAIPAELKSLLFGTGGANIKRIHQTYQVKIEVREETSDKMCKVEIIGKDEAQRKAAAKEIKESCCVHVFDVPNRWTIGAIIGSGGSVIQGLENEYQVRIKTVNSNNQVKIIGSVQQVNAALQRIKAIAYKNSSCKIEVTQDSFKNFTRNQDGGWRRIKALEEQYSVRVHQNGGDDWSVVQLEIVGEQASIAIVGGLLQQACAESCTTSQTLSLPKTALKPLVGTGGSTIKWLQKNFRVTATANFETGEFHIKGAQAQVDAAVEYVQGVAKEYQSKTLEFSEDKWRAFRDYHGDIEARKRIYEQEHGVTITVVRKWGSSAQEVPSQEVHIVGDDLSIEDAAEKMKADVDKLQSRNIRVPAQCMGSLIGCGSENIKKLEKDHYVKIQYEKSDRNDRSDRNWCILGEQEAVASAVSAIEQKINNADSRKRSWPQEPWKRRRRDWHGESSGSHDLPPEPPPPPWAPRVETKVETTDVDELIKNEDLDAEWQTARLPYKGAQAKSKARH